MSKKRALVGVVDCETDPFLAGRVPMPFAVGLYLSDSNYRCIWAPDCIERATEIFRKMPESIFYAHNGGRFDFFYFLEYANHGSIKVRDGRIFEMAIGKVILRDSWPLMPFALEEYRKTPIDYRIFESDLRDIPTNRARVQSYLFDDCKSLYDLVTGFREIVGPRDTIGAAAFYQMRKLGIEITSLNETHDSMFRPYFFGGRVEAFDRGIFSGNFQYVDINSAYPFAMTHEHAHGADYAHGTKLPRDKYLGQCFVSVRAKSEGAFPLRGEDGSLSFPNTTDDFNVTGWELIAALETKTARLLKIHEVWRPQTTIEFSPFVSRFYELRRRAKKDGDRIAYLAYKYLLNSGYGKFAQNPREFCEYCLIPFGEYPDGEAWEWETDYGAVSLWQRPSYDGFGFYDVATGASITGFQRAQLLRGIRSSKDLLYCDTDALLCGKAKVTIGDKLGQWKLEGNATECCIAGKKLYAIRGKFGEECEKVASKGARLSYNQVKAICKGRTISWTNQAPTFSAAAGAYFVTRKIKST